MIDKETYPDATILLLRRKLKEKQIIRQQTDDEIIVGIHRIPIVKNKLFAYETEKSGFTILLPHHLAKMEDVVAALKYPMSDRPEIIITDSRNDVTFLFDRMKEETADIDVKMRSIREVLRRAYRKNVFYDSGQIIDGDVPVSWFEYKGNCMNGKFYCMTFGFYMGEYVVLGNFQCSFESYDYWKDAVLKLLRSIKLCNR